MPGSTSSCTSTVTTRSIVTDSSGNLWDLGNKQIYGIQSADGGNSTVLIPGATTIPVSFSEASAAFNAS
jgi:hypothetical protein